MRILFLSENFPPEVNAPATRTWEHCREWVKRGHQVTVITCAPNFPQGKVFKGYKNKFYQSELIDGINVVRVWTYIAPNSGFIKRIVDYISFSLMSSIVGLFFKYDVVIGTSPQFFTTISAYILSIIKNKPWVFELRDLWPESIKAVDGIPNYIPFGDKIISFFESIELFLYNRATLIVSVTDSFKNHLIGRGIDKNKIKIVKNGVDVSKYAPRERNKKLIDCLGLNNKIIISYIGTHGMAHGLPFILDAINGLDHKYHFLFIGDGAVKQKLIEKSEKNKLSNITFLDFMPKDEIIKYLSITDIALINLKKNDTFKSVIPSKIFENACMEIPILLGVEGEAAHIIDSFNSGETFIPENHEDFIEKINLIYNNLKSDKDFYRQGLNSLAKEFNRENKAKQMIKYLEELS